MKRRNVIILVIVWLLVMVGIASSTITLLASGRSLDNARWVSGEEAKILERYSRLDEVRKNLAENYYQEVDEETLIEGAIRGMMSSLEDPYTFYYSPEEMQRHTEQTEGAYQGIGTLIQSNSEGYIEVIRVFPNGPAYNSGIQVGDLIVSVDGTVVSGRDAGSLNEALALLRTEKGGEITLSVLRNGKKLAFSIKSGDVSISNVSFTMLENEIGYINIYQFSGDAVEAFEAALNALRKEDVQGLVIDLRNNPGGILDDVVEIADSLLPEGTIVYTQDRNGSRKDYYSDAAYCKMPLAVLVNGMSASASEILAAAVQDFGCGTIIGTQSYGKGIVQTLISFEEDGAGMQYTSACYYTPSGKNINGTGVKPDIVAESNGYQSYSGIPEPEVDIQLKTAIGILTKEIDEGEMNDSKILE